jgi:hypothetical protein
MSRAAKSIFTWGILMLIFGTCYLFVPNILLSFCGLPQTIEAWIRVVGLLIAILGGYYLYCARHNDVIFFRATVTGRIMFALGLSALVAFGFSKPILLVLGTIDTFGAIWTWQLLRISSAESTISEK